MSILQHLKPTRRIDKVKMPLEDRMKDVKAALTKIGYSVESYTVVGSGRVYLRLKSHAVGGGYERAEIKRRSAFVLIDGPKF